ncbi:MAG: DUF4342 domain-containing protein [Oscillospiraceae bacterium]|nr:DUF4342 domain-containing protein [Oscillospiraceae bacterium]
MENIEMIEKLMEKADVTFEEGKGVLESVNWNLLDALIALEKEGKIRSASTSSHSTKQDISEEIENIRSTDEPESFKDVMKRFFSWVKKLAVTGMDNRMLMHGKDGREIFGMPVTVLTVLLVLSAFTGFITVVLICLVIAFFRGCSFSFEGPDLGTEKVNSFMSKIKFTGGRKSESDIEIDDRK